jgi:hypothetical protein
LRFKIDNGRALNGRDVYLRDERDQVTSQLFTVVVRSTVVFSHGRLLEEVGELRDFPPPPFLRRHDLEKKRPPSHCFPSWSRAPSHGRWLTKQREQRGHEPSRLLTCPGPIVVQWPIASSFQEGLLSGRPLPRRSKYVMLIFDQATLS